MEVSGHLRLQYSILAVAWISDNATGLVIGHLSRSGFTFLLSPAKIWGWFLDMVWLEEEDVLDVWVHFLFVETDGHPRFIRLTSSATVFLVHIARPCPARFLSPNLLVTSQSLQFLQGTRGQMIVIQLPYSMNEKLRRPLRAVVVELWLLIRMLVLNFNHNMDIASTSEPKQHDSSVTFSCSSSQVGTTRFASVYHLLLLCHLSVLRMLCTVQALMFIPDVAIPRIGTFFDVEHKAYWLIGDWLFPDCMYNSPCVGIVQRLLTSWKLNQEESSSGFSQLCQSRSRRMILRLTEQPQYRQLHCWAEWTKFLLSCPRVVA